MKFRRFLAGFIAFVIIIALIPAAAFAIWVNDDGAHMGSHTFQCSSNGKLDILFYNSEDTRMNFYEYDGEFFVDDASLADVYLKEGFTNVGNHLSVSANGKASLVMYDQETFGYFKLIPIPDPGYMLNKFIDPSCGCLERLKHIGAGYYVTPESVKTLEAVFLKDPDWVAAPPTLNMTLNGEIIHSDILPFIENSRTMVPVRFISEALGAKAEWDDETKTVTVTADGMVIKLVSGDLNMVIEKGAEISVTLMDAATTIKDGRAFVPVRFIAEALGLTVDWYGQTKTVVFFGN